MGEKYQDFDVALAFLGEYGRFQILMMVLLSLTAIPCGYMGMLSVFIADTPTHRCRTWFNSTPHDGDSFSRAGPDNCYRYKADANRSEAVEPSNGTDRCEDGWIFSTESHTIVSEWELVCENAWKVPFSTSVFFIGVLFGSLVSGQLSDRFGRKHVLFFTISLQSVTALIQATSVNWVMFCALNCLRGVGHVACFVTSLVLGSEMLGESARLVYTLLGQCLCYSIGYALLPLFAYLIRSWRLLLVASAIPGLVFIFTWWIAISMVYYGLSLNTSNLKGNIYLNCLVSAATDAVAYIATFVLMNRAPRHTLLCVNLMFSGLTLLVVKLVPEDTHAAFQVLVLMGKLGVSVGHSFIYFFFTELYPTVVRNTGLGVLSTSGRIGTIVCPYILHIGIYSKVLPYIIFGSFSIIAAILSLVLPDTRNCKFPDLISEAKPIRCFCMRKENPLPASLQARKSSE
ncbi:solute carrier family 22 member 5-like isoform X3 [Hippocampus comes]|uniref:solute carrier family 22 member 5-like isoform X3 n=1 Tax=Hippocampus comes TaxID=109280 RepID=UPI00094EEEC8|nr:PREDICTED: solute carrier family 22 member 5-like isoform X3 [Hippocampus comes]